VPGLIGRGRFALIVWLVTLGAGCTGAGEGDGGPLLLNWYVYDEPSGAFIEAARRCTDASDGAYRIRVAPLPTDADQQREQVVRRLAARDPGIDLIGMDVIWTAELANAGWILPWPEVLAREVESGRLDSALESVRYAGRLWAVPFTTNTQLLWYRTDRVPRPPETWDELFEMAESLQTSLGHGTIQVQGERYEGLTVFFVSLLASAGGQVLAADGRTLALPEGPTREALDLLRRLADSSAADPGLASAREDHNRLAFERGDSSFMLNYTYVWPSARANTPEVAGHMGWARWPAVSAGRPSRVTLGGINLGVAAYTRHPELAFAAAICVASADNQRMAAARGGLPPTVASLYDDPEVRATFPFADLLSETLADGVQRPRTPSYSDLSLAIGRVLHPYAAIDPETDGPRLREALQRALRSEGLW
jgi:multiple sugar transport system substrate-binding protein